MPDRDVLAYFHSGLDFHAHFAHDVDFGVDYLFVQFVTRNAVCQHAACAFVLFKHRRVVALLRKIEGATKSCGTAADNGNLFLPASQVACHDNFRHKAMFVIKVLFGNKFLYRVNAYCLVDCSARACVLATTVTNTSANCRERVFTLDEFQRFAVLAFRRLFEVTLYGDVRRASRLTRTCARFVAVYAVAVAVVLTPHMFAPTVVVGKRLHGVGLFAAVGMAQLLTEFDRACRAVLYATSARHALGLVHVSDVRAARHIGRVEQLACTQCVADVKVTVAYSENLAFAVDVGHLVNKSVVLGAFKDVHCLLVGNVHALAGFAAVVRHVTHAYAPQIAVVGTALVEKFASVTATAHACADVSFVTFQPVTDMFDVHGRVFHFDGFFNGNHVHADACSSRRNHCCNLFKRQKGHTLEEHCKFRMAIHKSLVHVGVLCRAGHEQRNPVLAVFLVVGRTGDRAVFGIFVAVVVFQHTKFAQFLQKLVKLCASLVAVNVAHFQHFGIGIVFAHLHLQHKVKCRLGLLMRKFVLEYARKAPVLGVCRSNAVQFCRQTVGNFAYQLQQLGVGIFVVHVLGYILFADFGHVFAPLLYENIFFIF